MSIEIVKKLLAKIEEIQSTLIAVATGKNIQEVQNYYKELYRDIQIHIEILNDEGLKISNPNTFKSLWDWNERYRDDGMNSYKRQTYIYDIYLNLIETLQDLIYINSNPNILNSNIKELNISELQLLLDNILEVKRILEDTATHNSKTENKDIEELYSSIYNNIELQIIKFWSVGLRIANPNFLRKISYWKAYYLSELEGWSSRREFINTLYANIVNIISKSLRRQSIKNSSKEEFFQELNNSLSEQDEVVSSRSAERFNNLLENSKQNIIDYSNEYMNGISQQESVINETDIVIITALPKEKDAIVKYLNSPEIIEYSGQTFHKASVKTSKLETVYQVVIVCLPSMGNKEAAIATEKVITKFNPRHIILVGIAGGIPKQNRYLGDVIVGEQIVDYELNKQIQQEVGNCQVQRRYEVYRPATTLLEAAKKLSSQNWFSDINSQRPDDTTGRINPDVHFGVVASGSTVIADQVLRDELREHWSQLVGVEMEGAGVALAAYKSDVMFLVVKSICDWADGSKNDDWQEYAAETAASFVIELLKSAPFESKLKLNLHSHHVNSNKNTFPEMNYQSQNFKDENSIQKTYITIKKYSGKAKIEFYKRLGSKWEELADYFEIESNECATFDRGKEARRIWEWLENRSRLYELEDALIAIGREDLAQELNK